MAAKKDNVFPFDIRDLDREVCEELRKNYEGEETGFVQVGPKKYFLPNKYRELAADIYNMPIRPSDTFVCSYPRSGTTWSQELVWMVANDLDYAGSDAVPLPLRFPFLELSMVFYPSEQLSKQYYEENKHSEEKIKYLEFMTLTGTEKLLNAPSPRFIKTHLPPSLLPPTLLETAKMVYVARDPRDVVVSLYHLKKSRTKGYVVDFQTYWKYFKNDLIHWSPYFEHVKEAWNLRHHRNLLFLFYEELSKDLPASVRKVADFYGKKYTAEEIQRLCQHLSIDSFKNNVSVNKNIWTEFKLMSPTEQGFIRKGKAGGWREYFDEDLSEEAEQWIAANLQDTDLRYPHMAQP